ncbi:hypothetical protein NOCA2230132 [metagenome]|uniref:Uncharacterized protein n=1 Tax=metagenome TaxID=256318 RepID=A0A2P2C3B5_9ZZZZ
MKPPTMPAARREVLHTGFGLGVRSASVKTDRRLTASLAPSILRELRLHCSHRSSGRTARCASSRLFCSPTRSSASPIWPSTPTWPPDRAPRSGATPRRRRFSSLARRKGIATATRTAPGTRTGETERCGGSADAPRPGVVGGSDGPGAMWLVTGLVGGLVAAAVAVLGLRRRIRRAEVFFPRLLTWSHRRVTSSAQPPARGPLSCAVCSPAQGFSDDRSRTSGNLTR